MSIEAMSWVLKQDMSRSSEKFILVCLANYSDEHGICYPSARTLMRDTGQDRKTVLLNIKRLCESGMLRDTGKRVGGTASVIVYEIVGLPSNSRVHYVYRVTDLSTGEYYLGKRSFNGEPELDTYRGSGRWVHERQSKGVSLHREVLEVFDTDVEARASEMRWFKLVGDDPLCKNEGTPHALRRDKRCVGSSPVFPNNGSSTVFPASGPVIPPSSPVFPASSSVIPPMQAQKRDTEPPVEPPIKPSIPITEPKPVAPAVPAAPPEQPKAKKAKANPAAPVVVLPDWLPQETWDMWVRHRAKVKSSALDDDKAALCLKTLARLRAQGHDPVAVIETSVERGWTGLFELKAAQPAPTASTAQPRQAKFDPNAYVQSGAAYANPAPASAVPEPYTIDAQFVERSA